MTYFFISQPLQQLLKCAKRMVLLGGALLLGQNSFALGFEQFVRVSTTSPLAVSLGSGNNTGLSIQNKTALGFFYGVQYGLPLFTIGGEIGAMGPIWQAKTADGKTLEDSAFPVRLNVKIPVPTPFIDWHLKAGTMFLQSQYQNTANEQKHQWQQSPTYGISWYMTAIPLVDITLDYDHWEHGKMTVTDAHSSLSQAVQNAYQVDAWSLGLQFNF